jgi:hypothetical protein
MKKNCMFISAPVGCGLMLWGNRNLSIGTRVRRISLLFVAFIFISLQMFTSHADDMETTFLKEAPKPAPKVFELSRSALLGYKEYAKNAWGSNVEITFDANKGLMATNWHKVHKGEAEWMIEVIVWGGKYRVDVWERPSIGLFRYPRKGYMCRLEEMRLQQEIDKGIM